VNGCPETHLELARLEPARAERGRQRFGHVREQEHAVRHDAAERASGGDLGGPILQDLSLRFPGLVDRMVLFNSPLPYDQEHMAGMRTRPAREASDYFVRQGTDPDALAAASSRYGIMRVPPAAGPRRVEWIAMTIQDPVGWSKLVMTISPSQARRVASTISVLLYLLTLALHPLVPLLAGPRLLDGPDGRNRRACCGVRSGR